MLPAKLEPADNANESDVHQMELQSLVYDYPTVREYRLFLKGNLPLIIITTLTLMREAYDLSD